MGLRGPQPKSNELRVLEGERAHRPLPAPRSAAALTLGLPERPKRMSAAARRIWDEYSEQLAQLGTLRPVDGFALRRLCEDVATLEDLQIGMRKMAAAMRRVDAERLKTIDELRAATETPVGPEMDAERAEIRMRRAGGALLTLGKSHEGRRITATINALASRVARQEMQFGLTPASAGRVEGGLGIPPAAMGPQVMSIEDSLCG